MNMTRCVSFPPPKKVRKKRQARCYRASIHRYVYAYVQYSNGTKIGRFGCWGHRERGRKRLRDVSPPLSLSHSCKPRKPAFIGFGGRCQPACPTKHEREKLANISRKGGRHNVVVSHPVVPVVKPPFAPLMQVFILFCVVTRTYVLYPKEM